MSVKDLYSPNINSPSYGDKLSDQWLGTNRVDTINMNNAYELQKAVNVNKYSWNKQGMVNAGINPIVASQNVSSVANSQTQGQQSGQSGFFGENLLKFMNNVINKLSGGK